MRKIPIDKVDFDRHYYCRVNGKPDWITVLRYKEAVEAEPAMADPHCKGGFPAIVVVALPGGRFLILDGLHRLKAFTAAGLKQVWAEVEKLPKSKWMYRSSELNLCHGRLLDNGDRTWIAKRLEADGFSRPKVAELLKVTTDRLEKMIVGRVQKLTAEQAEGIQEGRANRKVNGSRFGFVKSPFLDLTNTSRGVTALKAQGVLSNRTVGQVLDAAIAVFIAGAVDLSDEEISGKIEKLAGLLEAIRQPST